jgi:hypothetical protein
MNAHKSVIFSTMVVGGLIYCLLVKAEESDFSGSWGIDGNLVGSSKRSSIFEIKLKETSDGSVTGSYCSVTQSGNRIDCSTDDTENISGYISKNGRDAEVNFYSFFGGKAGVAVLSRNRDMLTWKVTRNPTGGPFYGPSFATLSKKQFDDHQDEREVVLDKAYLYPGPAETKVKIYLVKGDYVRLIDISSDLKFWNVSYIQKNGTEINRWIDCRAINFCP